MPSYMYSQPQKIDTSAPDIQENFVDKYISYVETVPGPQPMIIYADELQKVLFK